MSENEATEEKIARNRNFQLLWFGSTISQFGDQFYLLALPWLVLLITGDDAMALGSIMAAAAIPRVVLMVFGGAVTDRISPRLILIVSASLRAILVFLLAVLVLSGLIKLWMLFVLAIVFGIADAFAAPAATTLLPRIVQPDQLPSANAFVSGAHQIAGIVGPVAAGFFIAFFGSDLSDTSTTTSRIGIGAAFIFDAVTFLFVILALGYLKLSSGGIDEDSATKQGFLESIKEGISFVFRHPSFRVMLMLAAIINLAITGPMAIGLPYMARTEFGANPTALGWLMSAMAFGSLIGFALGGGLPRPNPARFGSTVISVVGVAGIFFAAVALAPTVWWAMTALTFAAMANGYANILIISWFQLRSPKPMLGRVLSLVITVSGGLAPVSMAAGGALINLYDIRMVLGCAAISMAITAFLGLTLRSVREMDLIAVSLEKKELGEDHSVPLL
tara:strand:+ start:7964 stop:9304 length:1341 start_codon:yes stop_codon:yes gene_type:complete